MLDVDVLRSHFPALAEGAAHFDGAGGTQTADVVGDAIRSTMLSDISNRNTVTAAERRAEEVVTRARGALADLLEADPGGVVFGRSMTQLTFDFSRALAKTWRPGDEVALSRLDHDANVRPWVIAAQAAGVTVRWIDFDPATGELTPDHVREQLSEKTRLVALTGASNLIGTRPALRPIADLVHATTGALFYVDAVHLAAHAPVSLPGFGADFLACSPYKFFGPHCGVVAAAPALLAELHPDKLLPSSDSVPERFELGTLPYELMAGVTAAIDFIAGLAPDASGHRRDRLVAAMSATAAHEDALRAKIETGLDEIGGITVWSRAAERTPTLLLTFDQHEAADAYPFLADRGVNVPAGSFYAYEPARHLGLGPAGGLRISLSAYNNDDDVNRLLAGIREFVSR
ncbi:cysteine desulfurase-like protein [Kineosporia sp. NBRC 101731]|uniref:cysteine desulfurase-like protein n=1 Tax=Kineosporia sp. NBRC 101731 TaxID=3032199 RepID=UPI0024A243A5|nr:cysteine desulfurase-like protein [Kineosporia sp. NBRC 101731]GLY28564.1 cysteine desulfurase-like protein [Kineosporia sp. NBRC 101731]